MSIRVWFAGSVESGSDLTLIIPPKQPYLKAWLFPSVIRRREFNLSLDFH